MYFILRKMRFAHFSQNKIHLLFEPTILCGIIAVNQPHLVSVAMLPACRRPKCVGHGERNQASMRISRHCYAITGLASVLPWTVNAGIIAGDPTTLVVDTGPNMQAARTIYGYAKSVRLVNRLLVVNTEGHLDHIGGNSLFYEQGIDIYGHHAIARTDEELDEECALINALIPERVRREHEEARIFYASTKIVNPNKLIDGDTHIDLGSFSVQVLATPGHTVTNISVFAPTDGVLFCGDCIVSAYLPNMEEGGSAEWQTWLASLARFEELAPEIVVPGHGEVLRGREITTEISRTRKVLETAIRTGQAPTF
jgi:glyoxylase-like metal-dependent hydrolase (beta-lactamase superfamily II)